MVVEAGFFELIALRAVISSELKSFKLSVTKSTFVTHNKNEHLFYLNFLFHQTNFYAYLS